MKDQHHPSPEGRTDEQLADAVRHGDLDAYGVLWERHSAAGLASARQFSNIAEPDDLVADAYVAILRALQRGGGPHTGFRSYLYSAIRNTAFTRARGETPVSIEQVGDLVSDDDGFECVTDDHGIARRAFESLNHRWQRVLWFTAVEELSPAEVAPKLGMTPNGVAALAVRAREGFRRAWIQAHVGTAKLPPECDWSTQHMGDYLRSDLKNGMLARFEAHVPQCDRCSALLVELADVSRALSVLFVPGMAGAGLVGIAAAAAAAEGAGVGATAAAGSGAGVSGGAVALAARPRILPTLAATGGGLAATTALVVALGVLPGLGGVAAPEAATLPPAPPTAPVSEPTDSPQQSPGESGPPTAGDDPPSSPAAPPAPRVVVPDAPAVPPKIDEDDDDDDDMGTWTLPTTTELEVLSPAPGDVVNSSTPQFIGVGQPGATVTLDTRNPRVSATSTVVGDDGIWRAASPALSDGHQTVFVTQELPNVRAIPVEVPLLVDTCAAPPVFTTPVGPHYFLPLVSGTAEPGATVELLDSRGGVLARTTANGRGDWEVLLPDPGDDAARIRAVQTDAVGNRSEPTHDEQIPLHRPTIVTGPTIGSTTESGTTFLLSFTGVTGMQVEVLIDGIPTGNLHTLTGEPLDRQTMPLAPGTHTLALRYVDRSTGEVGATLVTTPVAP